MNRREEEKKRRNKSHIIDAFLSLLHIKTRTHVSQSENQVRAVALNSVYIQCSCCYFSIHLEPSSLTLTLSYTLQSVLDVLHPYDTMRSMRAIYHVIVFVLFLVPYSNSLLGNVCGAMHTMATMPNIWRNVCVVRSKIQCG